LTKRVLRGEEAVSARWAGSDWGTSWWSRSHSWRHSSWWGSSWWPSVKRTSWCGSSDGHSTTSWVCSRIHLLESAATAHACVHVVWTSLLRTRCILCSCTILGILLEVRSQGIIFTERLVDSELLEKELTQDLSRGFSLPSS